MVPKKAIARKQSLNRRSGHGLARRLRQEYTSPLIKSAKHSLQFRISILNLSRKMSTLILIFTAYENGRVVSSDSHCFLINSIHNDSTLCGPLKTQMPFFGTVLLPDLTGCRARIKSNVLRRCLLIVTTITRSGSLVVSTTPL